MILANITRVYLDNPEELRGIQDQVTAILRGWAWDIFWLEATRKEGTLHDNRRQVQP
jgi:hypothetical protein